MAANFRAWAEVDLGAIRHNFRVLREEVSPCKVMAVLKANAYGHGAVSVAKVLSAEGVDAIGVGDSQEALELRAAGITTPLLVMGAIVPGEVEAVIQHDVQANVHSLEQADEMDAAAARVGKRAQIQLMVDTGMGRLGVDSFSALTMLRKLKRYRNLELVGLCTHFSSASEPSPAFSLRQIERFDAIVSAAKQLVSTPLLVHAASHAAMLRFPQARYDMVRPGLALYGVSALDGHAVNRRLRRALTVRSQIAFLKDVSEGTPISYSRQWYSPAPTRIATLPIGYNDGYRVALSGKAHVLVRGVKCPVVGRVSMDYAMVDVGEVSGVRVGDAVTLIGKDGDGEIRIEDLADQIGTVPYEVSCGLGRRVQRVYRDGGAKSHRPSAEAPRRAA